MLGDKLRECPYVENLWVNGVVQPLWPEEIVPLPEPDQSSRNDGSGRRVVAPRFPMAHAPRGSPLEITKPEFIQEMRYVNCWSRPPAGSRSVNALFITLKPGIAYDVKQGAYVADSAVARAANVIP